MGFCNYVLFWKLGCVIWIFVNYFLCVLSFLVEKVLDRQLDSRWVLEI